MPFYVPVQSPSSCRGSNFSSHTPSLSVPSLSPSPAAQHCRPAVDCLASPAAASGLGSACAEQPEGAARHYGAKRDAPPLPHVPGPWGHTASWLKVTSGRVEKRGNRGEEEGYPSALFIEGEVLQGSGWGCCFCSSHTTISPRDPLADPPFSALPSNLGFHYS